MEMQYFQYSDEDLVFHYSEDTLPLQSNFKMHSHEQCELYYFSSGKGIFHIEGSEYALVPGDILVMREEEAHYIEIDGSTPYIRAAFHFSPELTALIDPSGKLTEPFYDRMPGQKNLFRADRFPDQRWRSAIETMLSAEEDGRPKLMIGLISLLWELHRVWENSSVDGQPGRNTPLMQKVLRYINDHHTEALSLSDLCHTFGVSRSGLCRMFKQSTGATVGEYLTVKRLAHARALLRSGMQSTRAAALCGFTDYSAFYRAYRRRYGCSPRQTQ